MRKKIGEILVEYGLVTDEQCMKALHYQKEHGGLIGEVLMKLGYIEHDDIVIALSEQHYDEELNMNIVDICRNIFKAHHH